MMRCTSASMRRAVSLGVILVIGIVAAQEHLMLRLAKHLGAQLIAHPEARNHLARHLGRAREVVAGARRDVVAHELFRHAPAQEDGELVEHLDALSQSWSSWGSCMV